jgi:hypothetical protein
MIPTIRCEFRVMGNFDPDIITQATGVVPTKIYRVGDPVSTRASLKHTVNSWIIRSGATPTWNLADVLAPLVDGIKPQRDILNTLKAEFDFESEFSCVVEVRGETPGCVLSSATLADIASFGADLDIDIYLLPEKRE